MRYLIALPLKNSESSQFIELREKYKNMAPRWKITLGPHITLYRPSAAKIELNNAISEFKNAAPFSRFTRDFTNFDAFIGHSSSAVYYEPKDYESFEQIKNIYLPEASKIMQDTSDAWPFHPHITLVNRLDSDSAIALKKQLASTKLISSYEFDRVCLYKKELDDINWIEIASNKLEK
jgi:2'-5' RNA ligase